MVLALCLRVEIVHAENKPKSDMRVLIDVSGSMKKNDPDNLRIPATKLLLNLAQPGNRLGLWTFGRYVNMLVPHGTVTKEWKDKAIREADKIGSVALFTNIGEALEASAKNQWQKDPAWDRTIVLLSDGMVDISTTPGENAREQKRIFEQLVPKLVKGGYKVHAVALSEQADVEFLQRLANETGGHFSMASTADQLMHVFVDASDRANQPLQVPMEGGKFKIDSTVTEFTALIYRRAGSPAAVMKTPSGKRITLQAHASTTSWFNDERFDLVTVQAPEKGAWDLEGDLDPDNRVTVVSNLDLALEGLPDDVIEGEKITLSMHLSENSRPIIHPHFLSLMDITFAQETDRGEKFQGKLSRDRDGNAVVPPDGKYLAKLGRTLTEGEHEFTVAVDGKTFKRTKKHHMTVHKEVIATSVETDQVEGHAQQYLSLQPKVGLVKPESLNVIAEVVDPNGGKSVQEVVRTNTGQMRVNVPPFNGDGVYQVFLKTQGKTSSDNPFEVTQGPYEIDYTPVGSHAKIAEVLAPDTVALHEELDVGEDAAVETEPVDTEKEPIVEEAPAEAEIPESPEIEHPAVEDGGLLAGDNMAMLLSVFAVGNLLLFGGGGYLYMRFLKKQDADQSTLVEQLSKVKENAKLSMADTALQVSPTAPAAPVVAQPVRAPAPSPMEIPSLNFDDEQSTVVRATAAPAPAPAPPQPPAPVVPAGPQVDRSYKNEAAPLALDDDELIELDDELDGDDELGAQLAAHAAAASQVAKSDPVKPQASEPEMDELDMILAEQEALEAQLGGLDIDTATSGGESAKEREARENEAKKKFVEDEFMLDNPTNRS